MTLTFTNEPGSTVRWQRAKEFELSRPLTGNTEPNIVRDYKHE
jgi:hypothetical protein